MMGSRKDKVLNKVLESGAESEVKYSGVLSSPSRTAGKGTLSCKNWHKPSKRKRRTSCVEADEASGLTAINSLSQNLSQLELKSTTLPPIHQSPVVENSGRAEFLPSILYPHVHPISSYTTPKGEW